MSSKNRTAAVRQPRVDAELLLVLLRMVLVASIVVVDFVGDWNADVLYQGIGAVAAVLRLVAPDSPLISEALYLRIATRVLRPLGHSDTFAAKCTSAATCLQLKTVYVGFNGLQDAALVSVGVALLFSFSDTAVLVCKAVFRELWFIVSCLRLAVAAASGAAIDPVVVASCCCEIVATSSLAVMLLTRGAPVPTRVVGALSLVVTVQKLVALFAS